MHQASDARYSSMPYHRCGKSGLLLPAVSLGFWHNFGDTGRYETMKQLCFTAFDHGITHFDHLVSQFCYVSGADLTYIYNRTSHCL